MVTHRKVAFAHLGCYIIPQSCLATLKGKIKNCYIVFSNDSSHVGIIPVQQVRATVASLGSKYTMKFDSDIGVFHKKHLFEVLEDGNLTTICGTCKHALTCIAEDYSHCHAYNGRLDTTSKSHIDLTEFEFLSGRHVAKPGKSLARNKNRTSSYMWSQHTLENLLEKVDLSEANINRNKALLTTSAKAAAVTRKYREKFCSSCFFHCETVRDNKSDMVLTPEITESMLGVVIEKIYGRVDNALNMLAKTYRFNNSYSPYEPLSTHYEAARWVVRECIDRFTTQDEIMSRSYQEVSQYMCPIILPLTHSLYSCFRNKEVILPEEFVEEMLDKTGESEKTSEFNDRLNKILKNKIQWMFTLISYIHSSRTMHATIEEFQDSLPSMIGNDHDLIFPELYVTLMRNNIKRPESDIIDGLLKIGETELNNRSDMVVPISDIGKTKPFYSTMRPQDVKYVSPDVAITHLKDSKGLDLDKICAREPNKWFLYS